MSDRTRPTHVCPLCSAPMGNGPFDECRGDADKTHRPVAGIDALPYGRFLPNEEALAGRMAAAGTPIIRIAGFPAVFLMGGRPGDNWHFTDALRPETGARGYFPGVDDAALVDAREGRIGTRYAHGRELVARRIAIYRKARRAALMSAPPMSGGSPWAARDTGWHADGCLCRSCAAVSA